MPLRPQVLYPAHAKRHPAVTGGNVAIISGENPRFAVATQGGNDALASELDRLGLDYELTKGKYGAPEKSFIVQNPDLATVLDLGRRFGQESVAWSENGRHQLHFVNGDNAGMATVPSEVHEWHDEEPQDNYTAVPSPHGDPWGYFTWNIDLNSPMIPSQQQLQPRTAAPQAQAQIPAPAQGAPSPSPSIAKSLSDDVRAWMERLGELRMREMKKAEVQPGVFVAPGVQAKRAVLDALAAAPRRMASLAPQQPKVQPRPERRPAGATVTQAPVTGNMNGRAAVLGMKKGEEPEQSGSSPDDYETECPLCGGDRVGGECANEGCPGQETGAPTKKSEPHVPAEPKQAPQTGSQVNVEPSGMKKPDWQPMGSPMKKSVDSEQALVDRRVREREDAELKSVPIRDSRKGDWPKEYTTKVPSVAEERRMGKSETVKADPLDEDAGKHACKGCGMAFSPVVAALRKAKGSLCLKCEGGCGSMGKSELKYERNEPQHGAADNAWRPKSKTIPTPGSGGLKKTSMPMEAHAPAGAAVTPTSTVHPTQHVGPLASGAAQPLQDPKARIHAVLRAAQPAPVAKSELEKGSLEAKLGTGKTDHIAAGAPTGTNMPNPPAPAPVVKAEGMSTPKAPGAGSGMGGGSMKAGGSSPPKMRPLGLSEASAVLHKSIRETVSLRKAQCHCGKKGCKWCNPKPEDLKKAMDLGSVKAGMRQASFEASRNGSPTGMPTAGKLQPKSPAEYDAAAFRPASPGAAGAPSGLELDTEPKHFAQGSSMAPPPIGGMAAKPIARPAPKTVLPIAKLTRVVGAPLSKPKL